MGLLFLILGLFLLSLVGCSLIWVKVKGGQKEGWNTCGQRQCCSPGPKCLASPALHLYQGLGKSMSLGILAIRTWQELRGGHKGFGKQ